MKKYQDFKYKIRIRLDGRYFFAVWWADANSRRDDPIWLKTVASKRGLDSFRSEPAFDRLWRMQHMAGLEFVVAN